jgi:riboflavin kinase/FMN adenylyltransferase
MTLIQKASQVTAEGRPVCVALGMFDGVHLGHQRVLATTVENAQALGGISVAITFDRHPNTVVAPERTPALIYSLRQRLRAIARLHVENVWLIHFDAAFSRQPAEDFVADLVRDLRSLRSVSVGRGFTFGHKRSGTISSLRAWGQKFGFNVHEVGPVMCDGEIISSTRIRRAIHSGNFDLANHMLGRRYSLAATVIEGQRLGRQLGFPTANLDIVGLALPPSGVYAGIGHAGAMRYPAVMNVGFRPTIDVAQSKLRVEVHLLDFAGELYGEEVEFECLERLRPEKRFASLEDLRAQIQKDVAAGRRVTAQVITTPSGDLKAWSEF